MANLMRVIKRLRLAHDTRGATLVEYILLIGVIAVTVAVVMNTFGKSIKAKIVNQTQVINTNAEDQSQ